MESLLELDERAQAGEIESEPVEGKPVVVDYRIFINGFPKAGTHLVEQYIKPICPPMKAEVMCCGGSSDGPPVTAVNWAMNPVSSPTWSMYSSP